MPEITYNELMSELDKYRINGNKKTYTEEQIEFLKQCRNGEKRKVAYPKMVELWEKVGWGHIDIKTLTKGTRELGLR
jgi:hypothetical protein